MIMQRLILTIDNLENTQKFLQFIEQFNFIETVEITNPVKTFKKKKKETVTIEKVYEIPESKFNSVEDIKEYFGIWEGRDITKESLRKKAWRVC
jgi:hypothetical protein